MGIPVRVHGPLFAQVAASTNPCDSAVRWLKQADPRAGAHMHTSSAASGRPIASSAIGRARALADAYRTLGCDRTATAAEVTTAYEVRSPVPSPHTSTLYLLWRLEITNVHLRRAEN